MKTFLQSAIDSFESDYNLYHVMVFNITNNKQWNICKSYSSILNSFGSLSKEESVTFLLFMAAIHGEI